MIIDIYSALGWGGMALVVAAYFLLSIKKLKPHSIVYNLMNMLGGAGLVVSTFVTKSWPSLALNALWVIIAFFSIFQIREHKQRGYKELK